MEVTKKNFEAVLATLPDVFSKAQFLALDTEFTGLRVEGANCPTFFDSLEEKYLQHCVIAETYMAVQIGIAAFFYDESSQKYTHQAYNFYVFPSSYTDINFTCQSKTIEFLMKHGFDFNKLFKDGIPYLNTIESDKVLEKCQKHKHKIAQYDNSSRIKVPFEHEPAVNTILSQINDLVKLKKKKTFTTERFNSFIRKLIYNSVQHEYGSKILLEPNTDETITIYVGYTEDELEIMKEKNFLEEKNKILGEIGFSKVIKLITDSGKLLIGHNLLVDILFIIKQFITPLPKSYTEFKDLVTCAFPSIIDTKYMATTPELQYNKDTSLFNIVNHYKSIDLIPEVNSVENSKGYSLSDENFHEAAYDAFLTGLSFLAMSKILGNSSSNTNVFKDLPASPFLLPIINKLSISKTRDILYMNIGGSDKEPDRSNVYHLTFPAEWKRDNILDLFKKCGNILISWINSTSAYIQVKPGFIHEVNTNLIGDFSNYTLCTYEEYQNSNYKNSLKSEFAVRNKINSGDQSDVDEGNSPFKLVCSNSSTKRQIEDLGEITDRSLKKRSKC